MLLWFVETSRKKAKRGGNCLPHSVFAVPVSRYAGGKHLVRSGCVCCVLAIASLLREGGGAPGKRTIHWARGSRTRLSDLPICPFSLRLASSSTLPWPYQQTRATLQRLANWRPWGEGLQLCSCFFAHSWPVVWTPSFVTQNIPPVRTAVNHQRRNGQTTPATRLSGLGWDRLVDLAPWLARFTRGGIRTRKGGWYAGCWLGGALWPNRRSGRR